MILPTKNRTFIYKQADFTLGGQPLEDRLLVALNGVNALNRCEEVVQGSGIFRVVNTFEMRPDEGVFLTFMLFNENQLPHAISLVDGAASFPVHVINPTPPAALQNTPLEIVESLAFALIRGDHVIFMNTSSLRWKRFGDHLNWLLSRNLDNIPAIPQGPEAVRPSLANLSALYNSEFDDYLDLIDLDGIPDDVPVDKIVFSQPFRLSEQQRHPVVSGVAGSTLQTLFGARRNFLRGLNADEIAQVTRINTQVTFTLRGEESTVMNRIGRAIQGEDDIDYIVHLANGTKLRRDQVERTKNVKLEVIDKNFVPRHVRQSMADWLVQVLAPV